MVIPIHDENPLRRRPIVTWSLIAVNIAVFLAEPSTVTHLGSHTAETVRQACHEAAFFDQHAAIPRELIHNHVLGAHHHSFDTSLGTVDCPDITEHGKIPFLSVLEAMFLHASWAHLLGNMLYLLIFGNNVEDRMGRVPFLGFYVLCGYVAAYGFALGNQDSTVAILGASGAIAGVLGAYLVVFPGARVTSILVVIPVRLPAWVVLGGWFLLQWAYLGGSGDAAGAGVAYLAHVYGFLAGAFIALLLRRYLTTVRTHDPWHRVVHGGYPGR
ncbi:MAG: rhomboid family intramembrane serine protease [Frankiaceae bacterium]|nr:rhomboid family intramembrane serine protease [Frankiaceae bacterium]MBV9870812.1 rhomboid family intramembrane serine protease [Frankiaceae bacterium]